MKLNKIIIVLICIVPALFVVLGLWYNIAPQHMPGVGYIKRDCNINKNDFEIIEVADTHGGFHGDGEYYIILDCKNNKEKALKAVRGWNELPMTENLSLMVYGGERGGIKYCHEFAKKMNMPYIEHGYYHFADSSPEATGNNSDENLFGRVSYNFGIAVYDTDTDMLYYYRIDT